MPTHTEYRRELDRLRALNAKLLEACRRALPWCEHVAATAQAVSADLAGEAAKACRAAIAAAEATTTCSGRPSDDHKM